MIEINSLLESVHSRLEGEVSLPHQASAIAYDLFILTFKLGQSTNFRNQNLVSVFISKLQYWELDDLIIRQVKYAIRIANSNGKLEYEEMHKLFSLCDEIYALDYLGLDLDKGLIVEYEESIRRRFKREKLKAKMVAEDRVEKWQENFWWYKSNLN